METSTDTLPLRILDRSLWLTRLALAFVTAFAILLVGLSVFGVSTSLFLEGSTDEVQVMKFEPGEYQIEIGGEMADVGQTTSFESDDGRVALGPTKADIHIADDAVAIRSVAHLMMALLLALAWIGVSNMRGVSRSMRAGERFTSANVRRVRRVGAAALAYPPLLLLGQILLRHLVDGLELAGPPVSVNVGVGDWWAWVLFGLLFVALAELFSQGVVLQELEEATI